MLVNLMCRFEVLVEDGGYENMKGYFCFCGLADGVSVFFFWWEEGTRKVFVQVANFSGWVRGCGEREKCFMERGTSTSRSRWVRGLG